MTTRLCEGFSIKMNIPAGTVSPNSSGLRRCSGWLGFKGVIANRPNHATHVSMGDEIRFSRRQIVDWTYRDTRTGTWKATFQVVRSQAEKRRPSQAVFGCREVTVSLMTAINNLRFDHQCPCCHQRQPLKLSSAPVARLAVMAGSIASMAAYRIGVFCHGSRPQKSATRGRAITLRQIRK